MKRVTEGVQNIQGGNLLLVLKLGLELLLPAEKHRLQ
jgi:hypothetical protein